MPSKRFRSGLAVMLAGVGLGLVAGAAQAAQDERISRSNTGTAENAAIGVSQVPQEDSSKPPSIPMTDTGFRDQRLPASTPNISGIWTRANDGIPFRYVLPVDGSPVPFKEWSRKIYEERTAAEERGQPMFDPTAACIPSGVPRMFNSNYPIEIVQTPDVTMILYESQHNVRTVRMNAKHPDKLTPSYMGDSVGHWENGDLVVDTVGIVPHTLIDEGGTIHSDAMHLVERWRRINDREMELLFTIDDPNTFTKPWTARRLFTWTPEVRSLEYICEENNRNAPNEHGVVVAK